MKKGLLIPLLFFFALTSSAATFPPADQLDSEQVAGIQMQSLMDISSSMYDKRDYRKAIEAGNETLQWLDSLPDELKTDIQIPGYFLYVLMAESAVRDGDPKQGLAYTKKAIEAGCENFCFLLDLFAIPELRNYPGFEQAIAPLREDNGDFVAILREGNDYRAEESTPDLPSFQYTGPSSYLINKVNSYFDLEAIAGEGDEISRIVNIMDWVHDQIPHNGTSWYPGEPNAIDIYHYSKATGNGVNCRMLATVLNECYLALGFKSRLVSCRPADEDDMDCHIINAIWSDTLDKWLWMDASYSAYVTDGKGNMLGIHEVRQRLIDGEPVKVRESANWNNLNNVTTEYYLYTYMAKNLYVLDCWLENTYNTESWIREDIPHYIQLRPYGTTCQMNDGSIQTTDPQYFWQKPE